MVGLPEEAMSDSRRRRRGHPHSIHSRSARRIDRACRPAERDQAARSTRSAQKSEVSPTNIVGTHSGGFFARTQASSRRSSLLDPLRSRGRRGSWSWSGSEPPLSAEAAECPLPRCSARERVSSFPERQGGPRQDSEGAPRRGGPLRRECGSPATVELRIRQTGALWVPISPSRSRHKAAGPREG